MAQYEQPQAKFIRLSDSELTVANPAEDVRGRKVIDSESEEVGEVDDLLLDDRETKVRFLEVASGGFLGLGATKFLIPVEAISQISDDVVRLNQMRQHIAGAPRYDPDLIYQDAAEGALTGTGYYEGIYRYYGYPPYWMAGYMYPPYPYYRRPV